MKNDRIYKITFASVYPLYVAKVKKLDRSTAQTNDIILLSFEKPSTFSSRRMVFHTPRNCYTCY
ncbi:DUF2200 family protein [Aequorivita aurantiaca]|uniref:DUF2200 family protein n=1 Tax=Aequorivita aurantiaca TaxID=3053356 RepID=UPI00338D45D4